MNIAIDMMGGDFAPAEAVKGVQLFLSKPHEDVDLILIGDEEKIILLLSENGITAGKFSIIHADQVIEMHEHPTKALKEKKQSSIAIGFYLLATDKADAFISAGNTGAMMVGALYSIKGIEGVLRPAIGAYLPKENGNLALLPDARTQCRLQTREPIPVCRPRFFICTPHSKLSTNPRVALVNLGEEEGKGNLLTQAAYPLLKENNRINFVGNAEGRDLLPDKADIYICEGFTGNVVLKFAESVYDIVQSRNIADEYFNRFNFEIYGGVPVLGVNKPVIIGHGISHAQAFDSMIRMAKKMHDEELIDKIKNVFLKQESQ